MVWRTLLMTPIIELEQLIALPGNRLAAQVALAQPGRIVGAVPVDDPLPIAVLLHRGHLLRGA
jgi:hypothetical protein